MDKSKFYLTPGEIDDLYFNPPTTIWNEVVPHEELLKQISEASANHAIKTLVEWMLRFRHDCIECGWTITPEHEDWQELVKLVEDM